MGPTDSLELEIYKSPLSLPSSVQHFPVSLKKKKKSKLVLFFICMIMLQAFYGRNKKKKKERKDIKKHIKLSNRLIQIVQIIFQSQHVVCGFF